MVAIVLLKAQSNLKLVIKSFKEKKTRKNNLVKIYVCRLKLKYYTFKDTYATSQAYSGADG